HVFTFRVNLPRDRYSTPTQRREFYSRLLADLQSRPGVRHAAFGVTAPFRHINASMGKRGSSPAQPQEQRGSYRPASAQYFTTLKIPVLAGRPFHETDSLNTPVVAIVNSNLARHYWGSEREAIGQPLRVRFSSGPEGVVLLTVVGVVGDVRYLDFTLDAG